MSPAPRPRNIVDGQKFCIFYAISPGHPAFIYGLRVYSSTRIFLPKQLNISFQYTTRSCRIPHVYGPPDSYQKRALPSFLDTRLSVWPTRLRRTPLGPSLVSPRRVTFLCYLVLYFFHSIFSPKSEASPQLGWQDTSPCLLVRRCCCVELACTARHGQSEPAIYAAG